MSGISTSDVLGTVLAVLSWILIALIVVACIRGLMGCGWLCLD